MSILAQLVKFGVANGLELQPLADDYGDESKPQPGWRRFDDAVKTRQLIYDRSLAAARTMPPLENKQHIMRLRDVDYIDKGEFDIPTQKQAILGNKTLGRRMRGTWDLIDKATGSTVDSRRMTVARVPHLTDNGTFIHNGLQYTMANQLRLRPGLYTRVKENGEIETHANFLPGKGVGHRYHLDPAKGVFYMDFQQAKIPLMPLLRALGVKDQQLLEAWGPALYKQNLAQDKPAALQKLYSRVVGSRGKAEFEGDMKAELADVVSKMEFDPEVTQATVGKPYKNLNLDAVLDVTKKLLAVSKGEADTDDRDHLAYQTIHGPEDLLSERFLKDTDNLRRQLFFKASFNKNLKAIPAGALTKQVEAALLSSGLGQPSEEVNPAEILDKVTRITRLGVGGIGSIDSIPDEARNVQSSHLAFIDAVRTPESLRAGVDVYLAQAAMKGDDGRIYAPFRDVKSGKTVWRSPQQLSKLVVAFPGEMEKRKTRRVGAMRGGKLEFVPRDEVDLVVPNFENVFSPLASFVPGKSGMKAQRMSMGSRMTTQALGLVNGEAPYVRTGLGDAEGSFEERYADKLGAVKATAGGVVSAITPDYIEITRDDGTKEKRELYNNYAYNRKSLIHNTPVVKHHQRVEPGQLLAKSNYTNDKGVSALGVNLTTGYMNYKGLNFEDAIVISESAAKKLASQHMYQNQLDVSPDHKVGKKAYWGLFPTKYTKAQLDLLDDDGVVKPGTVVKEGDPLVLAAKRNDPSQGKVHKRGQSSYGDATVAWEHHNDGVVTDVFKGDKSYTVFVKSNNEMVQADKLSGLYGDKGIVSKIIPDNLMPIGEDGKPLEVLVNELGVISRGNPIQVVAAVLGKIAAKTGKHYDLHDFNSIDDLVLFAKKEAQKHGVKDLEDVTDPETGKKIPKILVGNRFFMKLSHTAEDKLQGRSIGGYTQDDTPARGGTTGSKRMSLLDSNAVLSHGATEVLRDAGAIRGQKNEDYWLAFMRGITPPQPKVPMVYEKFMNQLRSAGVNVVEEGTRTHIMALTNKDVDQLAGDRLIENGETVKFEKDMEPVRGGLFDARLTGGNYGKRWSAIKLAEPMLNPVMEEPARRILGLTKNKFLDVLSGKEKLPNGQSGPEGIAKALRAVDIDRELDDARAAIASGKKTKRDEAVRKMGYLKSAKRLGVHPGDWVLDRAPVLPPAFRPVSVMQDSKLPLVADANYLYKELIEANKNLESMRKSVGDEFIGDERLAVYNAFKAVTGLGAPVHPKLVEKGVRGVLSHVFGSNPKAGSLQRRLVSRNTDLVGRAVIAPNPDLDMDHVGLPEDKAWDVYKQFVVRNLSRRGVSMVDALRHVKDRTPLAKSELVKEMKVRPVIINRAPVLHRFGVMAFHPRLVKGDVMELSPLVVKGFSADFDGDAMQFHVPASDDAVNDALEKMLPSRNLLSPADFKSPVHGLSNEYVGGVYKLSRGAKESKKERVFANAKAMLAALAAGELDTSDPVALLE